MTPDHKIRIVVVDDQTLFAHMLKTMLETRSEDFEVVGLAFNGQEALGIIDQTKPDLVLLDVKMPVMDGVRTAKELVKKGPLPRIIMLTTFDDNSAVHEVLGAGVSGYILKDCAPGELFSAIKSVHAGTTSFSAPIIKQLLHPTPVATVSATDLNRREREILLLVAQGLENHEIAERLFIAEQTVKNNLSTLYTKFDIKDRTKLVKLAEQLTKT
ncbi:MAG: response regulator transcription factor [Spirochaetales bacterium]